MKTGYAKVCINPPYNAPIVGYYEPRFVKGIADDLYARAIAFDDGERRAVVIALDLCYLPTSEYTSIKNAIVEPFLIILVFFEVIIPAILTLLLSR